MLLSLPERSRREGEVRVVQPRARRPGLRYSAPNGAATQQCFPARAFCQKGAISDQQVRRCQCYSFCATHRALSTPQVCCNSGSVSSSTTGVEGAAFDFCDVLFARSRKPVFGTQGISASRAHFGRSSRRERSEP